MVISVISRGRGLWLVNIATVVPSRKSSLPIFRQPLDLSDRIKVEGPLRAAEQSSTPRSGSHKARRGAVAARQAHNLEVSGSNPLAATPLSRFSSLELTEEGSGSVRFIRAEKAANQLQTMLRDFEALLVEHLY